MSIHSVIQQHYRIYWKWQAVWDMCSIVPPHYRSNWQPMCFAAAVLAGVEHLAFGLCPHMSPFKVISPSRYARRERLQQPGESHSYEFAGVATIVEGPRK